MAQNMSQANIGLLDQWRAAGNTGDLPVGWSGNGGSSGGGNGGGANTAAYDSLASSLPKAGDLVGSINTGENAAFGDYLKYLSGQQSPLDFYTQAAEAQGVPALRKTQSTLQGQIYDLEDTLRRVEPNVSATTGNSMVTEAQRQGIVTERQKPLIENLGWLGQSLGRVSNAVTEGNQQALTLTGLNSEGVTRMVDAYKTKLDMVSKQGDRALQAFTTDMDNQLNISLAKIHRGEQVSDQEAANAFAMLKAKNDFDNQVKLNALTPKTQVVDLGGRKVLIDSQTGKEISAYNDVAKPGTGLGTVGNYYNSGTTGAPAYSAPAGTISGGWYSTGGQWVKVVQ